ncbi:phosphate uptake regulator PhoU, partial [Candidatus Woesearchaeota archaeon]|nr:phosphate uptake regulator PhoU [Candidatus Woesearchaeota archaeon]
MEYRKLISFGKSSFVISLPKTWVNGNKLKKGDTVFLDERNADLLLSPKEVNLEEEQKEITIEVDGKPVRRIQREIITAYVMHYKTIILVGNEIKDKAKDLQEFIQNLVALEIMEQTSRKIVAKDFLNMNDLSTDNIIRKMDIVTRAMLEDCKNMFTDDVYENINHRDNDVNRLRFLM